MKENNIVKILHVASFKGNIGDNANHLGFYSKLEKVLSAFEIEAFEIRDTFRGTRCFDQDFVNLCNKKDLVIFGGGNFFELWVEKSKTGCSIDIDLDLLRCIDVPIVFNSLGVDPGQGASPKSISKFRKFLDVCISKSKCLLSVRNDGAYHNLCKYVGKEYASHFYNIHDAGFYFKISDVEFMYPMIDETKKNILFQIAGDMQDIRFSDLDISYNEFIKGMSSIISELSTDYNIILCPHIFKDIKSIYEILEELDDKTRRDSVSVAPYIQGNYAAKYIFGLYAKSDLNVGMRFHANVCSLALNKNTIGLVNYLQIENLYKSIGSEDFIDVRKKDFPHLLREMIKRKSTSSAQDQKIHLDHLKYDRYIKAISELLH